jgi:hypothetical protein
MKNFGQVMEALVARADQRRDLLQLPLKRLRLRTISETPRHPECDLNRHSAIEQAIADPICRRLVNGFNGFFGHNNLSIHD